MSLQGDLTCLYGKKIRREFQGVEQSLTEENSLKMELGDI